MDTPFASYTEGYDWVFYYTVIISAILLLLTSGLMVWFVYRYHRSRHPRAEKVNEPAWLEITWTVIPVILVLSMFYFGLEQFRIMRTMPENALTVKVTGRMWDWAFEYPNGKKSDKLYVPIDQPVKLAMTSVDVSHSFYIPAFRIKEDLVPGRETYLWFKPQSMGPADVFCAEYCGQRHAFMMTKVIVQPEAEFRQWLDRSEAEDLAGKPPGLALLEKHSCDGCHSLDGAESAGPTFKGIFNRPTVILANGAEKTVTANEAYLKRAILEPELETVKGSTSLMPAPEGITPEEVDTMIEYLKTLK